jgi:hypothetical protein
MTKATRQGEGDMMKSDATGATCDKGASRRCPHVQVREGMRSANEKEREKKNEPGGAALRLAFVSGRAWCHEKRGQHSPLIFVSERGSLHTCEGKGAVSGERKRKEKGRTGKQKRQWEGEGTA